MSTGTNQEKRGAKEAYAKVKVEVATLEAEVEEIERCSLSVEGLLKQIRKLWRMEILTPFFLLLQVRGEGGSRGGAGSVKIKFVRGGFGGGTMRSLLSQKQDLKVYRNWMLKRQLQCGEVINFISNFEIKMRSHKVSKGDQKIYLLEALKPGVVRALDMRGGGQFIDGRIV